LFGYLLRNLSCAALLYLSLGSHFLLCMMVWKSLDSPESINKPAKTVSFDPQRIFVDLTDMWPTFKNKDFSHKNPDITCLIFLGIWAGLSWPKDLEGIPSCSALEP
jgi:uncharacterized membrane-anchored protein YitT (DUF2179 family)